MNNNILKREIIVTDDGSHTLFIPSLNEHYHSTHGAIQESMHIYINSGLGSFANNQEVNILEVGFGTGLNAFLTCIEADKRSMNISFTSIEKYPISTNEIDALNYSDGYKTEHKAYYKQMHFAKWNTFIDITGCFKLKKIEVELLDFRASEKYDLVYFDAFGPDIQPKLWTEEVFKQMYNCMNKAGVLVTYSAKGQVRRNMQAAGFNVERLPGPPGKREILRATK